MGKLFEEQNAMYILEQKSHDRKVLEDKKKYGQSLLEDMKVKTDDLAMNEVEWSLNMDAMKAIHTDPHLNSRLAHRLRMTLGTPSLSTSR